MQEIIEHIDSLLDDECSRLEIIESVMSEFGSDYPDYDYTKWREIVVKRIEETASFSSSKSSPLISKNTDNPILLKYIGFFKHLNRSNRGGELAPHKLVLLMAVIKLYDNPRQQNKTVIQMSRTLSSYFDYFWDLYVKSPVWINDISMPWTYMKSESFWHDCKNKDKSCWIEPELRDLLKIKENRSILHNVLKEQIPDSSHKVKPETQRNTDTHRSNKKWSKVFRIIRTCT